MPFGAAICAVWLVSEETGAFSKIILVRKMEKLMYIAFCEGLREAPMLLRSTEPRILKKKNPCMPL
jgi:hypothetical protein